MSTIVWLEQVGSGDLGLVGGKGANLGELVRAGFEVPAGFVVTTEAHARRNPDGSVPAVVADDIRTAWRDLVGDSSARVAVRSSATAEDLEEASFAGQQETYLGVDGADAVVAAVADCWASLYGERAVAYRAEHGVDEHMLGMGVVVQLMVPADAAGVMFTANPVNGHREQVVITAAWGLGESVVGGVVDPDTIVVDTAAQRVVQHEVGDKASRVVMTAVGTTTEQLVGDRWGAAVLDESKALELASLGRRVEDHFGKPQDIEWALDAEGFHLLQARPITALPDPVAAVPDDWPIEPGNMYFRASIIEQLPDPLTPLFADLMAEAVPDSLQALMNELATETGMAKGALAGLDIGFPTVNGYAFYRYSNSAMTRVSASSLSAVRMLYDAGGSYFLERWSDRGLPEYRAAVAAWTGRDLGGVPASELVAGVRELLRAGCRYYTYVQTIIPLSGTAEIGWHGVHRTLVGVPREPVERYVIGLDSMPLRAERELWQLGQWVRTDDRLAAAVGQPGFEPRGAAPEGVSGTVWGEWRTRFEEYLSEYGHTVYNLDFINPVPADDPAPILQALRFVVTGDAVDPVARQARLADERERATAALLESLDPVRRRLVDASLRWARRVVPAREDALAAMGLAWPEMRRLLAELGDRLVVAGLLAEADEVYWLTHAEAERLASGEEVVGLAQTIADRQAQRRGQALLHPPQYLPLNRLMSMFDRFLPARVDAGTGNILKGNAGSGGLVTGPARVIGGPSDFADFMPGDILVAEITTPAYTPLFAVAGGVVTDVGGVLSHGSIVAREYGIPAVLGTGSATHRISTGDTITVDGSRGEVRLEGAETEPQTRRWVPWAVAGAVVAVGAIWVARRRRR